MVKQVYAVIKCASDNDREHDTAFDHQRRYREDDRRTPLLGMTERVASEVTGYFPGGIISLYHFRVV